MLCVLLVVNPGVLCCEGALRGTTIGGGISPWGGTISMESRVPPEAPAGGRPSVDEARARARGNVCEEEAAGSMN